MTKNKQCHLDTHPIPAPSDAYNFLIEAWDNEHDFHYIDNKYHECKSSDITAYSVLDIKKKFCFPSKDPSENLIEDKRSDSQKVDDILRIWYQILTPNEKAIWCDIAHRDLSKIISLESGLRYPRSFIEKDIKAFQNLNKSKKRLVVICRDKSS